MTIQTGDKLPDAVFKTMTDTGPAEITTAQVFAGKRVALFAVPGAFTPTCTSRHLPNFVDNSGALKDKGVDTIACTAVNDAFVLDAWGKATGAGGTVMFLADGSATFAKAIGMDLDLTAAGLGVRSKRYAMVVEDGVVTQLFVEPEAGKMTDSSADALICRLAAQ